ncbi:MAG: hypothetical protein GC160_26460 [Acidobacteria bacterium]|nr:hypothetical protein [Acidobacteriota bacterium]
MTEEQAKSWAKGLAETGVRPELPPFDALWARKRLEEEFASRQRMTLPLDWATAALQSAAGLALAFLLSFWR